MLLLACCSALGSAAQITITLTPSDYNGYHISCFGRKDGAIDAEVSGGVPPYAYAWSNGADTEDIGGLPSGFYRLTVTDALGEAASAELTLVEPEPLRVGAVAHKYPGGYNISCHQCYNGSIDVTVSEGVPPYSYDWGDGASTQDRSGLGALSYTVTVTDANGCTARSPTLTLTQPERSDWTMQGNAGTDPAQHYIGSSDAQDVVFRSNGQERLRLAAGGELRLGGLAGSAHGALLMVDSSGAVKRLTGPGDEAPTNEPPGCGTYRAPYPWYVCGNYSGEDEFLGTINAKPLVFKTSNLQRMIIRPDGQVGIGTLPPSASQSSYRLFVEGGIATRDVLVKTGAWPDHVFAEGYRLMPMKELREFIGRSKHLPGIPSSCEVEEKGGVELGDLQRRMLEVVEQQALYILQLEERLARAEQRLATLETSK